MESNQKLLNCGFNPRHVGTNAPMKSVLCTFMISEVVEVETLLVEA